MTPSVFPPVDPFILQRLVELFDVANWRQTKEGGNIVWEYQAPSRLLQAAAERRAQTQGDLMPLLTVPVHCRTLLDQGKPLQEAELERWFGQLDLLPDGTIRDDDGESAIGSLADAQCAIVAVLVNLGRDWLDRQPEKAARCGAVIFHHLAHPPAPRRFMFDRAPFNMTWENFCAEAAPYFLAKDPGNREWRAAVAELAGRPPLPTVRALFSRAAQVRARLGPLFGQPIDRTVGR